MGKIKKEMRIGIALVVLSLFYLAAADKDFLSKSSNNAVFVYASQEFIAGMHNGIGVGVNETTVLLVDDDMLNPRSIWYALNSLSKESPGDRFIGLTTLYQLFDQVSFILYQAINSDKNFTQVMNYTLNVTQSPFDFQNKARIYQDKTKYNIYDVVNTSANLALEGDYYNAGVNFGVVVLTLYNINTSNSTFGLEPIDIINAYLTSICNSLNISGPTDLLECLRPNASAHVQFYGQVLDKAANIEPWNVKDLEDFIATYVNNLPAETKQCLANSQDVLNMGVALGLADRDPQEIINTIEKNIKAHPFDVKNKIKLVDQEWDSGDYNSAGSNTVVLARQLVTP
eukprot:TRINITY_DN12867_c0_g2_i4.p1 TRINITY_DN12867_c0_g2~~TRINITY_DN12867_c0_g2_i4.p1  ORF type:complete len:363 (-),score=90.95 TRINITY_DN12867_c0_g2_i4:68-1093(-)